LQPGDELLTTDHVYNSCRNILDHVAARTGSKVVIAPVPFPLESSDQVVAAVMDRVTARTRFALIDHVTSPTGLVLPAATIVRLLEDREIAVMVDGAHSPGMIPLEIEMMGASFYAGNCHKWLCGAPGSAFLWVRPDHVGDVTPAVISHGANDPRTDRPRLHLLFDYPGTIDPSPYLTVPVAIEFLRALHPDGLNGVMATNRALALKARSLLCETVGTPPAAPNDMIGSLAAVTLPPGQGERPPGFVDPLSRTFRQKWNIQVPVFIWPEWPSRNVRVSAAPYNRMEEYGALSEALKTELAATA
jgi:isopenicillin-N epimerase